MASNITVPVDEPQWNSKPAWKLPGWAEPVMVLTILFGAMFLTRRKGYYIFDKRRTLVPDSYLDSSLSARSSAELLGYDSENEDEEHNPLTTQTNPPKNRTCCGFYPIRTPNSSRFKNNICSRILQRFPFLIEMFYWVINYAFYRMTSVLSQRIFIKTGIWNVAQDHGVAVLEFEQFGPLSFLFPWRERDLQQWFMHGHQDALTILNKAYALIHIPGTVGFIAWYYYVAPSHNTFAVVRRTMTLTNFLAFLTFIFYPCMPPRLLPKEYGFLDTVHHDDAQSVWMSGKYVNALAAMPSMHFGYSFCIGVTFIYHSGILRRTLEKNEARKNWFWKMWYCGFGVAYPTFIFVTIIATANHYILDTMVAFLYVCLAFICNKIFLVFLPLEDYLLWALRVEKPIPSTGERFRERGGRF